MKKEQKLVSRIAIALTAGLFSIVPAGHAMPQATGANADNNKAAAAITTANNTMDIAGNKESNVLKWDSFSVAGNETVQFDKGAQTKNYLNIVNGTNMSEIYGRINGGRNVYLINPNGILFGAGAQVNVGNLAASTRSLTGVNTDSFDGTNALNGTAGKAAGDIINMGRLQAASVMLEGNEVRICNTGDLTSDGTAKLTGAAVIVKAGGEVNIGYETAKTSTRKFSETETVQVQDYADTSENKVNAASSLRWTVTDLSGQEKSSSDFMLVNNVYDLQNMDQNLSGRYMLAGDIDASNTSSWDSGNGFSPVGNENNKFTGILDGGSHTINGLHINRSAADYVGLIGYNAGTIQNVGLTGGSIAGQKQVGGVAGYNGIDGIITNVYNTGAVDGLTDVGSMAGSNEGRVTNAYNTGTVSASNTDVTDVGGVVGANKGTVTHVHNTGMVSGYRGAGGVVGYNNGGGTIEDAYNTGAVNGNNNVGGVAGSNVGSTITNVYNTGMVSGSKDYVGGVVGSNRNDLFKKSTITNVYNTGAVSGNDHVGGVAGYNESTITNVYNTGAVSGSKDYVGGVVGYNNDWGTVNDAYNTGEVGGNSNVGGVVGCNNNWVTVNDVYNTGEVGGNSNVGGVVGHNESTVTNSWYATTDAANQKINCSTDKVGYNTIGTGKELSVLQNMTLTGEDGYGFDANIWRTNAADGSTNLVATTPMLKAFKSTALDATIGHSKVQYGTAEAPLTNIYQTGGDVSLDMSHLSRDANVGTAIYGHNLTLDQFDGTGDTATWACYADTNHNGGQLTLQNSSGFTVNSSMKLIGTSSITLTTEDSKAGAIIDYGQNITPALNITANDIVLDTDRVNTAAGGQTTVTLTAAGTAKAGYTPTGIMEAAVNNSTVSVPDYARATVRTYYPGLTVGDGGAAISEGQWIKNVNELQAMGQDSTTLKQTYFLYGDIDASATSKWNTDAGFSPVGTTSTSSFTGTFDGLNHTITGLYIKRSETDYVGLIGYASGTIQNVGMAGGRITGKNTVSGVVGYNGSNSTVTNAYNTGMVSGTNYVGGVVGENHGTVKNVYNTGAVGGTNYVGGVVAYNGNGVVENVYNTGTVSGNSNVGGVVGQNWDIVKNVYNTGDAHGDSDVGGVVGYNGLNKTVTNAYNTGMVSGTNYVGGVVGENGGTVTNAYDVSSRTDAEKYKASTYQGFDLDTTGGQDMVWRIYEGYTTPFLKSFLKTVTVSGSNQTVEYDGNSHSIARDSLSYGTEIESGKVFLGARRNAGSCTLANMIYSVQDGYDFASENTFTINPKSITASIAAGSTFDKTYDGTTEVKQPVQAAGLYDLDGVIEKDDVSLNIANASAVYADKNAGTGKAVNFTGLALSGNDAANYTFAGTASGTGNIAAKNITAGIAAGSTFDKTYDGTTAVTADAMTAGKYSLNDAIANDAVSLDVTKLSGSYADKNAADNKAVSFKGLVLTGTDAQNYTLTTTELSGTGKIAPKNITAGIAAGSTFDKTYDGTTAVTADAMTVGKYSLNDAIANDAVSLDVTKLSGSYADKNAADNKAVSFTGLALTGTDAQNYTLTTTELSGTGKITAKNITAGIAAGSTFDKTYDGTTAVTADAMTAGKYSLNDAIAKDAVSLDVTKLSGSYTDKNAADNKAVSFTGLALTGTDAQNYTLTTTELSGIGKIAPKNITAGIAAGSTFDKTYDGTTAVTADAMTAGKYSLNDAIAKDAVSLDVTKLSGSYTDKNAADNKAVSFTGLALTGTDAQNYTLTTTELSGIGKITAKNITAGIAAGSTFDKTYDGTTAVTADAMTAGKYSLNDAIANDAVSLDVTKLSGSYTDKNAADNKAVSFTGLALTGTDAQNYTLTTTELSGIGKIAPKNITAGIAAGSTFDKTYDGTTAVTADAMTAGKYSLNDAIAKDAVSLDVTKLSGSYTDKNAADNKAVSFTGLALTGTDAQNYTLTTTELSGMGNIAPKLLDTIRIIGPIDKPQDGNDTAVLAGHYQLGADLAAGDEVSLSGSGHYEDALSGQHKLVTFRDLSLGGAEQSNYRLRAGLELTGYGSILASVQPVVPQPIQPVPPLPSEPDAAVQPVQPGQAGFQPGIPQMVAQNSWYHGLQLGSLRMEPMQMSFAQGRPPYFARIMNTGSLLTHKNLWLEISAGGIRLPEEAFAGSSKDIRFDLWDWLI